MAVRFAGIGGMTLAVLACLGAAACSGGSADAGSEAPAKVGACPAPVVRPAAERPAAEPATTVAAKYLAVREGALSACQSSTTSWEAQAKKLMTPKGWRTHPKDNVNAAQVHGQMKSKGWNVRVTVSCMNNLEAGKPRADWQPLFCTLSDATVDGAGKAVPANKLPANWTYDGDQNPAPLMMKKTGGAWLVDRDVTGLAQ